MKRKDLLNSLTKEIGFQKDDFKYFGEEFKTYEEFKEFQISKLHGLKKEELYNLYHLLQSIKYFKPRHIDFYNISDQYVISGVYFTKNNKLVTYSTV